jgi:hypothetical protein
MCLEGEELGKRRIKVKRNQIDNASHGASKLSTLIKIIVGTTEVDGENEM